MSDISKIKPNGADGDEYNLKDAVARTEIASTQNATGNPLTLTDCAPINAEKLEVVLEPKQDLHGQSYPYVGGAGKNKFNYDQLKNASGWSESGGEYSGNIYNMYTYAGNGFPTQPTFKANTAYTLSAKVVATDGNSRFIITYTDNSTDYVVMSGSDVGNYVKVTSNASKTISKISFTYTTNGSLSITDIQIEEGTSRTTFAPYENICPITGYDSVSVDGTGVNVWDEEWEVGGINHTTGADTSSTTVIRSKNYIPCERNTVYYLHAPYMYVHYYDADKNFISYDYDRNTTITTPQNAKYMRFNMTTAYGTTYNNDISINYPSTDTQYHAYQSTTASITFPSTVYGGKSDFVSGGTEKSMDLFDAGGATWNYTNGRFYTQKPCKLYEQASVAVLLCSQYQTVSYQVQGITDKTISSYAGYIYVRDDSFNGDASAFTTSMNGVQICYTLATPTTLTTPIAPLKLLDGINNISSNGTTINLGYQQNNVVGELKGEIEQALYNATYIRLQSEDYSCDFSYTDDYLDASFYFSYFVEQKYDTETQQNYTLDCSECEFVVNGVSLLAYDANGDYIDNAHIKILPQVVNVEKSSNGKLYVSVTLRNMSLSSSDNTIKKINLIAYATAIGKYIDSRTL